MVSANINKTISVIIKYRKPQAYGIQVISDVIECGAVNNKDLPQYLRDWA